MKKIVLMMGAVFGVFSLGASAQQVCQLEIPESNPTSRFDVKDDGTVVDMKTGLMWKQCVEGLTGAACNEGNSTTHNWSQALQNAQLSDFSGYNDWRLPNIKELRSIVEFRCYSPAANLNVFPGTPSRVFSSSTPLSFQAFSGSEPNAARYVVFTNGGITFGHRGNPNIIRLVRDM